MNDYIVTDRILISAQKETVWEILTLPNYIKQWDDVPETYTGGKLKLGSVLEWEGHAKMTVTNFLEPQLLQFRLYLPKLALSQDSYNINYIYKLEDKNGQTELIFEIGDFSPLPQPQDYYEASIEFVTTAKDKIKMLAEKHINPTSI